ncbi:endoribonuclease [Komarekiella sp. 'clone 1']|uniref:Endoribonuclease n=1 Tax=Komarekiella delphini-convector SJRDD-AB1 TaxID=2593771 RepID=A0AA40VNW7_9NOST|nr:endoribonuclease [Komarekiella delphini-convector SJRDD-AB1]
MSDIYQQIWNSDKNGFSVSLRSGDGWKNPDADILLDLQTEASGKTNIDLATQPLFFQVNEEKLNGQTYTTFVQLLNNYVANFRADEILTTEEQEEIEKFLDAILPTEPMKLALEYINQELGENLSQQKFRARLKQIWFEMYTNYYKGKSTHFCSGFEHVFVGEAKFDENFRSTRDRTQNLGEISGYHSWIKFYFDEKIRNVNFLGYKYDLQGDEIPNHPNVITLQMLQYLTNMRGEVIAQLFKKKGGFFVGSSPESEIAMGTVVYFESINDRVKQDKRRTIINSGVYDLVIYRNIKSDGSRGDFIRSFFPIFLGNEGTETLPDVSKERPDVEVVPIEIKNNQPVIIVEALANPVGAEDIGEWVKLQNVTDKPIDLTSWEMRDKAARPQPLSGILQPNEVKQFAITRSSLNSMQLSNRSGLITVNDQQSKVIAVVRYNRANSDEIIRFERTTS